MSDPFRSGAKEGVDSAVCGRCRGRGVIVGVVQVAPGMFAQSQQECEDCHGNGNNLAEEDKCAECKGEKVAKEEKEFEVKLDPGVPENHIYTFPGEGNQVVPQF